VVLSIHLCLCFVQYVLFLILFCYDRFFSHARCNYHDKQTIGIVAGTIAERCKMTAYLYYSFFLVGFVYPVVAHAFWSSNGFLSNIARDPLWGSGVIDLAGSGPVHMTGGVAALAAALVLGPRRGRFHDADGNVLDTPNEFPPHSVALQFLGTFCLWFGWYGFNPGSVLIIASANQGRVAGLAAVNTTLAACSGALSAMFVSSIVDYRRCVFLWLVCDP
jgi:ammonium transporter, Amt family